MTTHSKSRLTIDPTAIIHPSARLAEGVEVGAYSVIGEGVSVGAGTRIGPHVVIEKWTTMGRNNIVSQFVSIGAAPQDIGYKGEMTEVVIGDNNVFREFVTVHRATTKQNKRTVIGSNNLFMNYVHVAHDCVLYDNIIMANSATLAGHVTIETNAIIGGLVAIHQHVHIGAYCIIGGASAVSKDIPPYVLAVGNRAKLYGLNSIGLRRQGFSKAALDEIRKAYAIIFRHSLTLGQATERLEKEMPASEHAKRFVEFIKGSKRGIARERSKARKSDGEDQD